MTKSYKMLTVAVTVALMIGAVPFSTSASASQHNGYGVSFQHRGHIAANSAARHWRRYWGLSNPEGCGYWGWADCRANGPAPAYATSAGYCGPALHGAASVTGLGYYGVDYTTDPRANYYSLTGGC